MPQTVHVAADDRETDAGVIAVLREAENVEVAVERLKCGDYRARCRQGGGALFFERKTLPDLAASVRDGRLFRQAARLRKATGRDALVLEGTARDLAGSDMRREALQGALVSVTLFIGLPLLRAKAPAETARLVCYAARQQHRLAEGALPRPAPAKRRKKKRSAQLHLLQGLPGVGPARAEQLLDAFGSVEAVMQAGAEELEAVRGVGGETAGKIRWAVEERFASYAAEDGDDPAL